MSAYIVTDGTIRLMVEAALGITDREPLSWWYDGRWNKLNPYGVTEEEKLGKHGIRLIDKHAFGQILVDANYRSVSHRYQEDSEPPEYRHERSTLPVDPVQVLKTIDCFDYQSCEAADWEESEAYAICSALRHRAIQQLPGYDDAKWGAPEAWEMIEREVTA